MIRNSIKKLAKSIGFDIGTGDDDTQADLINGFCSGIHDSILDLNDRDTQIVYIVNKLEPKSFKILKQIVQYIELKENEK